QTGQSQGLRPEPTSKVNNAVMERPRDDQPHYGEHLGDPEYWRPYVLTALGRHNLPTAHVEPPFVGSFPTFLVGRLVVKLFGESFDGRQAYAAELAVHRLLINRPEIQAPALVATGSLFEEDPRWPYLITERLFGAAIRDLAITPKVATDVATRLGSAVALLHTLPAPQEVEDREVLEDLRETAPARVRHFGLPDHLVEQVPECLADAHPAQVLVHADITADHVFIHDGRLAGIIDWGDA